MAAPEGAVGIVWLFFLQWAKWSCGGFGASQLRVSDGRGAGSGGISQAARGVAPVFGGWAGRGHGDLDAAYGDAHQRTDLEELEADGAAGGAGKCGVGESDAPHRTDQHIGHRGEPQAQLVGPHGLSRGAVGVEIELAFLDPVLHVAPGAVNVLIELTCASLAAPERGDDEARIGLALRPLRLGDDAALLAPAIERTPLEILEAARRTAGLLGRGFRRGKLLFDHGDQAGVAGEP